MKSEAVDNILPFVIYFGDTPPSILTDVSNPAFTIKYLNDIEQFKLTIVDPQCYSVVIPETESKSSLPETLSLCKTLNSAVTRVVLLKNSKSAQISELYNHYEVFKVYDEQIKDENLQRDLTRALLHFQNNQSQQKLISEIKKQNIQLEELTTDLEKTIEVRTKDELIAKKAIEQQVSNMKGLNKFLRDLSTVLAIEEVLIVIRREIKKFHKVVSPVLIVPQLGGAGKIYYFHGASIHVADLVGELASLDRVTFDQQDQKVFLANNLGRPLGQIVSIPVQCEMGLGQLFFENSLKGPALDEFVLFIKERLQFIEITLDRVILDQEMRKTSYLWEKTFDGIGEPICIVDENYALLKKNQYFGEEGSECYRALTGEDRPCKGCPMQAGDEVGDIYIRNKHYKVQSYFLFNDKGAKTYVNHYVDMSKYEELHSKILQNEKLSAVGHLADHIAHELNNPLTGIRSLAQVLLDDVESGSTVSSDLVEVEKAAMRCQNIIRNLINFSKQRGEVKAESISLSSIVKSTLPLLKTALTNFEQNIHLIADESDLIEVEPQLIQQVVFNIVNNACQSMGTGGSIGIAVKQIKKDNASFVRLLVEDTGDGISAENLSSIFDPFFTTKQQGEGTGLGLSVCKQIIESYGGSIQAESHNGKGAKFSLFIPVYN